MHKKSAWKLSLVVLVLLASCKSPINEEVVVPEIKVPAESREVFNSGISFDASDSGIPESKTVRFTATDNWSTSVMETKASTWLSVRPESGKAGEVEMTVTAQANTGTEDREGTVTIVCGTVSQQFTVRQAGKEEEVAEEDNPVAFEDANFKAYCVESFDTNEDGEVSMTEASLVTHITCPDKEIISLKGIEAFKNLTYLLCDNNQIESLDLSGNAQLDTLSCHYNQLKTIDISQNTKLVYFGCGYNLLTSLDFQNNPLLTFIYVSNNQLTSLDVSNNMLLTMLFCDRNLLTSLDVSNNTQLYFLACNFNPHLKEIWLALEQRISVFNYDKNVAIIKYRGEEHVSFDDEVFKEYCVKYFDLSGDGEISLPEAALIEYVSCSEMGIHSLKGIEEFKILKGLVCDDNLLTSLNVSNNTQITQLWCAGNQLSSLDISNNTQLQEVSCYDNQLTSLDVSNNTQLGTLFCFGNPLTALDLSNNIQLSQLRCDAGNLDCLDLSNNPQLILLSCNHNQLTSLNVTKNEKLRWLHCERNQLTDLDVSNSTQLEGLWCAINQLTSLDVSHNLALEELRCSENPQLKDIWLAPGQEIKNLDYNPSVSTIKYVGIDEPYVYREVEFDDENFKAYCVKEFDKDGNGEISTEEALSVELISCREMQIHSLKGVEEFKNIKYLECGSNNLTSLDISNNTQLESVTCDNNQLKSLNVSNCTRLDLIYCPDNMLTHLDVSSNIALRQLQCQNNQLTVLDVSSNPLLYLLFCNNNLLTILDISNCPELYSVDCRNNPDLKEVWLAQGQNTRVVCDETTAIKYWGDEYVQFDDPVFKAYCVENFDYSRDGEISLWEAESIERIRGDLLGAVSFKGIEEFKNLQYFECHTNTFPVSLDLSSNTQLKVLSCNNTGLESLDISNNPQLYDLSCMNCRLSSLDVSHNPQLQYLNCRDNQLTSLDVNNNQQLEYLLCYNNFITNLYVNNINKLSYLLCYNNRLTSLDVSNNPQLVELECQFNQLRSLNVGDDIELRSINCQSNLLSSLDVSSNAQLQRLMCDNNQLTSLDVSNNVLLRTLLCDGNPYLKEIWLSLGQTIDSFYHDEGVLIKYHGIDD
jgi:Leucine-rich repeat (LRR) protein